MYLGFRTPGEVRIAAEIPAKAQALRVSQSSEVRLTPAGFWQAFIVSPDYGIADLRL